MNAVGGLRVSVVVPARDAAATLGECLRAIAAQNASHDEYEVIVVVDERTRDATATIARRVGATVIIARDPGAAVARNLGVTAARAEWIAFTDADCIPSRGWLRALLQAVEPSPGRQPALGAAGRTIGYDSATPAARFVDLSGGLQAERHLAHERYPWAPTGNVLYRRAALLAVGGFDARFVSYEGCDLHTRLRREVGGRFEYSPRAIVHHRHRAAWRCYWRQQVNYGRGYAQFFMRYADELRWTPASELRAWLAVLRAGGNALLAYRGEDGLLRRGTFIKLLAQRAGFVRTYWNRREAARWRSGASRRARSTS